MVKCQVVSDGRCSLWSLAFKKKARLDSLAFSVRITNV